MSSSVNFKVFHLAGFNAGNAGLQRVAGAATAIIDSSQSRKWWDDTATGRFSVVKCVSLSPGAVFGALAQRHGLERHLYTDEKEEIIEQIDSFEDRLFLVDFERQLLAVEWRRFLRRPPLNAKLLLQRLEQVLAEVAASPLMADRLTIRPIESVTEKSEFIRLFFSGRALELDVTAPGSIPVDRTVQLVNPNPDLEDAARDIALHDFDRNSLGRVFLSVPEDGTADLRRSAIARTMLYSGNPVELRYQRDADGRTFTRRREENGVSRLAIDIVGPISDDDMMQLGVKVAELVGSMDLPDLPRRSNAADDTMSLFADQ